MDVADAADARAATTAAGPPGPAHEPYRSLPALREAHGALLRALREAGGSVRKIRGAVDDFLDRGAATGAFLPVDQDRFEAQGELDYWATLLFRAGEALPEARLAPFDPDRAREVDVVRCPYPSLDHFEEADKDLFFGRESLRATMAGVLEKGPVVAVVGPRNCGKSSFIRAGLVPALKRGAVPGSEGWVYFPVVSPGSEPIAVVTGLVRDRAVTALAADTEPADRDRLRHEFVKLFAAAPGGVGAWADPGHLREAVDAFADGTALLVIDRLEEAFTLVRSEAERKAFLENLAGLVAGPELRHRLVLGVQSEFVPRLAEYRALAELVAAGRVEVTPATEAELREIILRPAEATGLFIDREVVDALVRDVAGQPSPLSLLRFLLRRLWEERTLNRVTADTYARVGGARKAVALRAEALYREFDNDDEARGAVRRLFLRMVDTTDGQSLTTLRVPRAVLLRGEDPALAGGVLDRLVNAGLVQLIRGQTPADDQFEPVHEALARTWARLAGWVDRVKDDLPYRRTLEAMAQDWLRLDRKAGLLDDVQLAEAKAWLASPAAAALSHSEGVDRLVEASEAAARGRKRAARAAREQARRQRRRIRREQARLEEYKKEQRERQLWFYRIAALVASVGYIAAMAAAYIARGHQVDALRQRNEANRRAAQYVASAFVRGADKESGGPVGLRLALNAALLLRAAGVPPTNPQLLNTLRQGLSDRDVVAVDSPPAAEVTRLAWSPGGETLAAAARDGTVGFWAAADGRRRLRLLTHEDEVVALTFHPRDGSVATATLSGYVRTWDPVHGIPHGTAIPRAWAAADASATGGRVDGLAFDPGGRWLATSGSSSSPAGGRAVAVLWDRLTARPHLIFVGEGSFPALAFSSRGGLAATAGFDGLGAVWETRGGQRLWSSAFRPPAAAGLAWSAADPAAAAGVPPLVAVAFDPTRPRAPYETDVPREEADTFPQRVAVAARDGAVTLWTKRGEGSPTALALDTRDAAPWPDALAFAPDGETLATSGLSGDALVLKVWDAETGALKFEVRPAVPGSAVARVAFDPGLTRCAVAVRSQPGTGSRVQIYKLRPVSDPVAEAEARLARVPLLELVGEYRRSLEVLETLVDSAGRLDRLKAGLELARQGRDDAAVREVAGSLRDLSGLLAAGDDAARRWVAEVLVEQGQILALGRDRDAAESWFRRAARLDQASRLDPAADSARLAAEGFADLGRWYADQGQVEPAEKEFRKAVALNPKLGIDPADRARRLAAPALLRRAVFAATTGKVEEALAALRDAEAYGAKADAVSLNNIAWYGSLWDRAKDVLPAAERAVALDPNDGRMRDTRGLARALSGDPKRAIEDFRAYIEWCRRQKDYEGEIALRESWIRDLEAGKDPFTPDVLNMLRGD